MIGKLFRLVLIALAVGFGALIVYRRQALRKMDEAVAAADDALRKYELLNKEVRKGKGKAEEEASEVGRKLQEAQEFRDGLAEKREKLKGFF